MEPLDDSFPEDRREYDHPEELISEVLVQFFGESRSDLRYQVVSDLVNHPTKLVRRVLRFVKRRRPMWGYYRWHIGLLRARAKLMPETSREWLRREVSVHKFQARVWRLHQRREYFGDFDLSEEDCAL